MKNLSLILILLLFIVIMGYASNLDNLFFKLSADFCNKIYAGISSYSSPTLINSLAILNERYTLNKYYSGIFSDQLMIDLAKKIQIVDRNHLQTILAEKKLDLAGLLKSSSGYATIGNLANVKGFLSVSVYRFSYKPITVKGFFTEAIGYEGSLSGSYKIIGLDSAYKVGSNVDVKDRYLKTTKYFAYPISSFLASLAGSIAVDFYYFSNNVSQTDIRYRVLIDSAVGLFSGWIFGKIFYKILP